MFDNLTPALLTLFLTFCVLWLLWQVLRRILSSRKRRREPNLDSQLGARTNLNEPAAPQVAGTVSTIPDAADVLALKAAIDNLARQVAVLEKRLASGQSDPQPVAPSPSVRAVEPNSELPAVTPAHRI